jgi:hypothetical protein
MGFGQIRHRDVVGMSREHRAHRFRLGGRIGRSCGFLLSDAANGFGSELPSCAGEGLRDALVSVESRGGHGLDEVADDVGEATNGRLRF